MRVLLDTNVLIRALIDPNLLSGATRTALEAPDNDILFSAASIWEIAIKSALGRADFQVPSERILEAAKDSGFEELPVRSAAALLVATLPPLHRDPFDRLLVAQAINEPARLFTTNASLTAYSELVVRV
jgi:PIN domain nuclease of toxin-antitoxin system